QDAVFRRVDTQPPPTPIAITAQQALSGAFDAGVVRIEATLLDQVVRAGERMLVAQADKWIFDVDLPDDRTRGHPWALRKGSRLQLTGICTVQVDEFREPRSFRIL